MNNPITRKKYDEAHPEMIKKSRKKWNINNPEYYKKYNGKNREKLREKNNQHYKKRNQRINDYKISKGCAICGYNKFASALCFHHSDENKDFCVASIKTCSWKRVKEEIKKCVILCLNCHAEEHEKLRRS